MIGSVMMSSTRTEDVTHPANAGSIPAYCTMKARISRPLKMTKTLMPVSAKP